MVSKSKKSCSLYADRAARKKLAESQSLYAWMQCQSGKKKCSAAQEKKFMDNANTKHALAMKDISKLWFVCSKADYDKAKIDAEKPAMDFWKSKK